MLEYLLLQFIIADASMLLRSWPHGNSSSLMSWKKNVCTLLVGFWCPLTIPCMMWRLWNRTELVLHMLPPTILHPWCAAAADLEHLTPSLIHLRMWLYFTVLQIKFKCCQFVLIFVGVNPVLELKVLEIHSFLHFSPTCFDILSWNFAYDFILLYYRSSSSVVNLR